MTCSVSRGRGWIAHRWVGAAGLSMLLVIAMGAGVEESVREGPRVMTGAEAGVGHLLGDVAFEDLEGKAGRLADYRGEGRTTVICMTGAGCPVAKKYGGTLAELEKRFASRGGMSFLLVNPDAHETAERMRGALDGLRALGFGGRYIVDRDGAIARRLGASSSAEAFVLDGAMTLVYRGAIDDQYGLGYSLPAARRTYLADAIDATLRGEWPAVAATTAPGCALSVGQMDRPAGAVTYHNRVSRIVQRNCQECHRAGEAAPFGLGTYGEMKDHVAMIKKVVHKGVMPPWFADAKVGHWTNDRTLAAGDRADLLAWIEAGAPEGDVKDAPLARSFVEGWLIGKPDQVFAVASPVSVPAKGPIQYKNVVVATGLTEDKWVSAVEVRVSQPQVVHHVLVFVKYPHEDARGAAQPDVQGGLGGYFAALVPNQGSVRYPAGAAKLLPKGAVLVFQIHYTPDGTAVEDTPKVGVIYAERAPEHEVVTQAVATRNFLIPPGEGNYVVRAQYQFKGPARLLTFMPHGHVRGKAWRYELAYPDGRTEVVLEVPRYDFNWQVEYHLREPIDVPAGTVLRGTAWYDNSDKNPANPDPTKWVRYGQQTTDEMMIGYFTGYALR